MDVATVLRATCAQVYLLDGQTGMASGRLSVADLRRTVSGVSVDSRSISPGEIFVALKGERVDGHDFVTAAFERGALGCIVSRLDPPQPALSDPAFLFLVPDPLEALGDLAAYWRLHQSADVIGITGSVGKTTTKEIVAGVLAARWPVLKSEGNLNTEIGLPLTLLRLEPQHRCAVLEMGMHAPGDIALLARIARPRVGIVTNVAPVHLERMGSIERIAREKSALIAALPQDGLAVLNGDDPWTRAMSEVSGVAPVRLVGLASDCDYRASDLVPEGIAGLSFTLRAEGRRTRMRTRVPGAHTIHAFLSAAAVARDAGMAWDEVQAAMETLHLEARQRVLAAPNDMVIVDDSYNASPLSMFAALDVLGAFPGTKIAVLGDMLELGPEEERAHRQVGARAASLADWLVARGPRSVWIAEEAISQGMPEGRVRSVTGNAEAAAAVAEIVRSSTPVAVGTATPRTMAPSGGRSPASPMEPAIPDEAAREGVGSAARWAVLVKGSRGMRMEEVVQALRGEG